MYNHVDRELVAQLAREGWTNRRIAAATGCTTRTVSRIRIREGISKSNPASARRMTPELAQAIEERLDDGWSYVEIARTLGTTEETVRRHFPGRGWTPTECGTFAATIRHSPYPDACATKRGTAERQAALAEAETRAGTIRMASKVQTPQPGGPNAYRGRRTKQEIAA